MIGEFFRLIRVKQWIKNIFVFVPILFSKHLFDLSFLVQVLLAFFAFSFASSMIYIFNDIRDSEEDRLHPVKKNRPIANGDINVNSAYGIMFIIFLILNSSHFLFPTSFVIVLFFYIILNVFYTMWLKRIVIVDILCIAGGFMLRVLGGALVIDVDISRWLILTTLFIALFMAAMKRRSELQTQSTENSTRKVLEQYSLNFIDQISVITATGLIICYALYSVSDRTVSFFNTDYMVFTTIFVVYGIFRYMFVVHKKQKGEDPTELILTDTPTLLNLVFYIITVIIMIYKI